MNRKQRRMAAKLGERTVSPGASLGGLVGITELLRQGVQHHQAGRLGEAEECYRKILAADENHFDGLHLLGVLAQQVGRSDLAEPLIGKAIALHDRTPSYDRSYSSDLTAQPRDNRRIAQRDLAHAHSNFSIVMMAQGRPVEALKAIQRSLILEETENTKLLFVNCLAALNAVPANIDVRANLARALSEPWGRPIELARFAASLVKRDDTMGPCIQRFINSGPEQFPISMTELAQISADPLLRSLLEATVVFDIELERYLTAARNVMLTMASGSGEPCQCEKDVLRFFCTLSRQCFINEYIFACSNQEQELVERLRRLLANALATGEFIPELLLVSVAAYTPLASLSAANLLVRRRWSRPVAQLVATHVEELDQERQLRDSLTHLTAIDGEVSRAVRHQYEENPYPRWVKASPVGQPTTIAAHLQAELPHLDVGYAPKAEAPEILIAGCGTGQQSIETARRFKAARVLAVDLSLASLCYAKRKTLEIGVKNIDYALADILQLGTIGREFDVIEASGVLHHLADPAAGWRELLTLLRPGGLMRLGLYSAVARKDISAARAFIAQRGYGTSAEEIRRARQELVSLGGNAPYATLTDWGDFFSVSMCRDLLFHVQEHQMSLPEVDAFLRQNSLQFLGFVLPNAVREKFRDRFPNDKEMTNLAFWHVFETENPATFTAMYQFWIRKAS
jgi:2-polyprenyl-3-methyl-5-hydroxy-6-metoxy-1,4-benzoquinol methylase